MGSNVGHLLGAIAPIAGAILGPETFGLSTLAGGALGGGLGGVAGGLLNGGGIGGALRGGLEGAAGGALPGVLGEAGDALGVGDLGDFGDIFGTSGNNGTALSGGQDLLGNGLQSGTGLAAGSTDAPLLNIGGGGGSSFYNVGDVASSLGVSGGYAPSVVTAALSAPASSGIGGFLGKYALPLTGAATSLGSNIAAQGQLKDATNKANAQLSPYLNTGGAAETQLGSYLGLPGSTGSGGDAASILASSPGYQFTLDQGNRALAAQQAAAGGLNSGAAMKAAETFGTGLANQTGQQYATNLANTANQGLSAAGQYGNNTTALGSAGANADIATGNTISQLLSGVGGKRVIGYDTNGKPLYSS